MDVFPKFVVAEDAEQGLVLIVAKCTFHKDLAFIPETIKGGGWWKLDKETKTFTLFGSSNDFGPASQEDIAYCIENNKVFPNKYCTRILTKDFKFNYDKSLQTHMV